MICLEIILQLLWIPQTYQFLCQIWKQNGPTKVIKHRLRGILDDQPCRQIWASSYPKRKTCYSVISLSEICSKHYWKAPFAIRLLEERWLLNCMWPKYDPPSFISYSSKLKDSKWAHPPSRLLWHFSNSAIMKKISSQIDINFPTLKLIINEIIGSMIPDLNSQLSDGIELPEKIWEALAKYDISDLRSKTFLDFTSVGMKFDLWMAYYSLFIYQTFFIYSYSGI